MGPGPKIAMFSGRRQVERGYALPSVLMIVTILTMVAGSVITLQYLRRQEVVRDIHILKSDLAARNGIARALARTSSRIGQLEQEDVLPFGERFDDGTRSHVEVIPWGMYIAVRSTGVSGRYRADLTVLAASRLTSAYTPALALGNLQHQLVMTGNARIVGEVHVGPSGATTGTLRSYSTPLTLPIQGKVVAERTTALPGFSTAWIDRMARDFSALLRGGGRTGERGPTLVVTRDVAGQMRVGPGDSVGIIRVAGSLTFQGEIVRTWPPLLVVVDGSVELQPGSRIDGLVLIAAADSIVLRKGASVQDAILMSHDCIRIASGSSSECQLFARGVILEKGAQLLYPSAAVAMDPGGIQLKPVTLEADTGSVIEGFAGLFPTAGRWHPESRVSIEWRARVVGIVYCPGNLTLDGNVFGSVTTGDLYFYLAPTRYFGWMKDGTIDRTQLPGELLIPPAVAGTTQLQVLKWVQG